MSLAAHVQALGRGPGRSRSLTRDEAQDAMTQMLSGTAAPEAIGALLMLLRMKGETAEEIAGFAEAAQAALLALPHADLDWPSYAAGRTRGAPWFLCAAQQVAQAGHRVVLHGWNGDDPKLRAGLGTLGIRQASRPEEIAACLETDRIVYLPLEQLHPALFALLNLRQVLGLRSCVNTVCRMLNPARAMASVQGVFHPSYRGLQADAAGLLGWQALSVIKGGGGEFERHPGKSIAAFGLREGRAWEGIFPALNGETRRLAEPNETGLGPRWDAQEPDAFEQAIIDGTAQAALETLANRAQPQQAAA